jgi:hypothetical protein
VSPWDEQVREIHTVIFHPPPSDSWLSDARHRDQRMLSAAATAEIVEILDPGGLLVFAAGFLRTTSGDGCDQLAQAMLGISRRTGLSLAFGIDIGPPLEAGRWASVESPVESFAFACEAGRPILWPARQSTECASENRVLALGGMRVGLLLGAEVFNAALRRELERKEPQAIVALTHTGPTARWQNALDSLRLVAPTLLVGESTTGGVPPWAAAPADWVRNDLGGTPTMSLNRYRPANLSDRLTAPLPMAVGGQPDHPAGSGLT